MPDPIDRESLHDLIERQTLALRQRDRATFERLTAQLCGRLWGASLDQSPLDLARVRGIIETLWGKRG